MAYRRFRRRFRGFSGRRSFRRGGLVRRVVRPPVRWERGNIFLRQQHEHTGDPSLNRINTVTLLGAVLNVGDGGTTDIGRALAQGVRRLVIGGMKFQIVTRIVSWGESGTVAPEDMENAVVEYRNLICSDRLLAAESDTPSGTPQPAAILVNWFTNTKPIATVNEVQDEQNIFPTRIHWQDFGTCDFGVQRDAGGLDVTSLRTTQLVQPAKSGANLRLRLAVDDDSCFVWHFTTQIRDTDVIDNYNPIIEATLCGTMWYRFMW